MNLKDSCRVQTACLILFLFLCFLHFFSQRPLWLDERFILKNMQELSYPQVFGPLKYSQAFPRLHLLIIKFFDHGIALELRLQGQT